MVDLSMVSTRKLVVMGFLVLVLVAGMLVVEKKQDVRKGAEVGPTVSFLPVNLNMSLGETVVTSFFLDTKGMKLAGMEVQVSYSKNELRVVEVTKGTSSGFLGDFLNSSNNLVTSHVDEGNGIIDLGVFSSEEDLTNLPEGILSLFKITFEAKALGTAKVKLNVSYDNLMVKQVGTDVSTTEIGEWQEATYVIAGSGPTGTISLTPTATVSPAPTVPVLEEAVLNFKMAFTGLKSKDAVCGQNWPVGVVVLGLEQGGTAVYTNVALTATNEKTTKGEVIFEASFPLNRGYSNLGNAIFIKGPQHLQMKYGEDGQTDFYSKEGGEILLGMDKNEIVYDFSGYSVLAGDISGATAGAPDGRVDGRDFSYIKSKISVVRQDPIKTEMVRADFDGDCMVGNVDLAIMMLSLTEKLGELY